MNSNKVETKAEVEVEIRKDVSLAALTTMRVGGEAEHFATVSTTHQLIKLVRWARTNSLPYLVLGGGSNILISDKGVKGLVIHNRCRQVRIDELPYCEVEHGKDAYLFVESGAATAGAARISVRAGLTGFEWAVSVPGTIGGAVVNNAGAHGGEVKDNLENALVLDSALQNEKFQDENFQDLVDKEVGSEVESEVENSVGEGNIVDYGLADLEYAYRTSSLKRKVSGNQALGEQNLKDSGIQQPAIRRAGFDPVVISANFRLRYHGDEAEPKVQADQFLSHRRRTQPSEPSLGSMFMNPPSDYAGRLIEEAGLKAFRVGGAQISPLHANFMINEKGATARDILTLVEQVQAQVKAKSGVCLIPEIQLVGEWD